MCLSYVSNKILGQNRDTSLVFTSSIRLAELKKKQTSELRQKVFGSADLSRAIPIDVEMCIKMTTKYNNNNNNINNNNNSNINNNKDVYLASSKEQKSKKYLIIIEKYYFPHISLIFKF